MLKLNTRRRWMPWEAAGPTVRILMSPLSNTLRARLTEEALVPEPSSAKGKGKPKFSQQRYQELVAQHCLHGWEGIVCDDGDGTPERPLDVTDEAKYALLDQNDFSFWFFSTAANMGLAESKAVVQAGNESAAASAG